MKIIRQYRCKDDFVAIWIHAKDIKVKDLDLKEIENCKMQTWHIQNPKIKNELGKLT